MAHDDDSEPEPDLAVVPGDYGDYLARVVRDPVRDTGARYGWHYRRVGRLSPSAAVSLRALPEVRVAVADLLP